MCPGRGATVQVTIAAPGLIRDKNTALVVATVVEVISEPISNDLFDSCYLCTQDQRTRVRCQEKIAVGVYSALETELGTSKIAQVAVREHTELKHRDQRHFYAARHIDRCAGRANRAYLEGDGNRLCHQPGIR